MNGIIDDRILADEGLSQRSLDKLQMADWVHSLAPWEVISHLTWRDRVDSRGDPRGIGLMSAAKSYEKFMAKKLPQVSYFYAVEQNPSREGHHVHALWADCKSVFRRDAWAAWFKDRGRARIEPVRNAGDVEDYCSKYVTKAGAWWNVKLQWHRVRALNGVDTFALGAV